MMAVDWGEKQCLSSWTLGWPVFEWIGNNLEPGKRILELGSGEGTALLARHWDVCTVEHDARWMGKSDRARYVRAPLVNGWYDLRVISMCREGYDLLIIDGPPGHQRANIIPHLELFDLFKPVIVDDVQSDTSMRIAMAISGLTCREALVLDSDYGRRFAVI